MAEKTLMWVHPMFKKKLKRDAASNDMSIINFTRKLATPQPIPLKPKKKNDKFEIKF